MAMLNNQMVIETDTVHVFVDWNHQPAGCVAEYLHPSLLFSSKKQGDRTSMLLFYGNFLYNCDDVQHGCSVFVLNHYGLCLTVGFCSNF